MNLSFEKDFKNSKHILFPDNDVSFTARSKEWASAMSDGPRSHRIPLNGGGAIKVITLQTIKKKKKDMKVPGNYDSYLIFNLEQLFHGNLFVLGDPSGSVNAPEAAAAAVLVEVDVIKLDLHEGGAGRQHLIMALGSSSPLEEGRKEGKSGSCSDAKQSYWCCVRPGSGTHWRRVRCTTWPECIFCVIGCMCESDTSALGRRCADQLLPCSFPGLCMDASTLAIVAVLF